VYVAGVVLDVAADVVVGAVPVPHAVTMAVAAARPTVAIMIRRIIGPPFPTTWCP
jgi:hypothetical protein